MFVIPMTLNEDETDELRQLAKCTRYASLSELPRLLQGFVKGLTVDRKINDKCSIVTYTSIAAGDIKFGMSPPTSDMVIYTVFGQGASVRVASSPGFVRKIDIGLDNGKLTICAVSGYASMPVAGPAGQGKQKIVRVDISL